MSKILKQVELALAYNCEDKIGTERLVQYIHHNRKANALRIDAMVNPFNDTKILFHLNFVFTKKTSSFYPEASSEQANRSRYSRLR